MENIDAQIQAGFRALEIENYSTARQLFINCVAQKLDPAATFNVHYGLALCLFHEVLVHPNDDDLLETAISHAEQAAEVYERRYDLQLLLGQCYATKYKSTLEPSLKEKAKKAYEMSKVYIPETMERVTRDALETRLSVLIAELGGN